MKKTVGKIMRFVLRWLFWIVSAFLEATSQSMAEEASFIMSIFFSLGMAIWIVFFVLVLSGKTALLITFGICFAVYILAGLILHWICMSDYGSSYHLI